MARLEASYDVILLKISTSEQQAPANGFQKELEPEWIREPMGMPWFQPNPKRRQQRNQTKSTPSQPPFNTFPPLPPSLDYLGVMIDAGRHYFPPRWLHQQLEHLHSMGYNWIHFRLTDDQNFVLNLTIPNAVVEGGTNHTGTGMAYVAREEQERKNTIAFNDDGRGKASNSESVSVVYQPEELAHFVKVAKERYNITVIPEVNIPGHAGAWGANDALSDLVVSCPKFACSTGYGIPLNVTHPKLPILLKHILTQVVEIFHHPPFLHLGGDELHMSSPCLEEAGISKTSSWLDNTVPTFEKEILKPIIEGLGYNPQQILRWENKYQPRQHRFGGITHYWETAPSPGTSKQKRFVTSTGLYLDVRWYNRPYGYGDFQTAQKLVCDAESCRPFAIVVGTFEMGMEFWQDRNVLGRLLAIRMGVAAASPKRVEKKVRVPRTMQEFKNDFVINCKSMFSDHELFACEKAGWPLLDTMRFEAKWNRTWKEWKDGVCEYVDVAESQCKKFVHQYQT